jgi:hypothetical protein
MQLRGTASTSNIEISERYQSKALRMTLLGMCRIRLSERISKHQQLKKKSAATALNTVLPQRTPKWPNSKPHWATRQQAIVKIPAKWSAYEIPSVTVVFVIQSF